MRHLYHPTALDPERPANSWWAESLTQAASAAYPELEGDHRTDVAIIGGGYTGLSAALHLTRDHHIEAQVLERAFPAGAPPAAMAASAVLVPLALEVITRCSVATMPALYRAQVESVELVGDLLTREGIDGSIRDPASTPWRISRAWRPHLPARSNPWRGSSARAGPSSRGSGKPRDEGRRVSWRHPQSGSASAQPDEICDRLAKAASRAGAKIVAKSPVEWEWRREGNSIASLTPKGQPVGGPRADRHQRLYAGRSAPPISAGAFPALSRLSRPGR